MKKTYNSPSTKVVKIALHHMIADSLKIGGKYNGTSSIETHEDNSWDIWGNNSDFDE